MMTQVLIAIFATIFAGCASVSSVLGSASGVASSVGSTIGAVADAAEILGVDTEAVAALGSAADTAASLGTAAGAMSSAAESAAALGSAADIASALNAAANTVSSLGAAAEAVSAIGTAGNAAPATGTTAFIGSGSVSSPVPLIPGQDKPRLGILPFTGGSASDGENIAVLFSIQDDLRAAFSIVPRTGAVNTAVAQRDFQTSTFIDSDTIARLGRMLNVDYVISGYIRRLGDRNLIVAAIVNVETYALVAGDYRQYGSIEEIPAMLPSIARNMTAAAARAGTGLPGLAIAPLRYSERGANTEYAEALAQILPIAIANTGSYAVLPRASTVQAALNQQGLRTPDSTVEDMARTAGMAINAAWVLGTETLSMGTMNMLIVQILNAENGSQLAGESLNYRVIDDGIALMPQLAAVLAGRTGASVSSISPQSIAQPAATPVTAPASVTALDARQSAGIENTKPVLLSIGANVAPYLFYRTYNDEDFYLNGYIPLSGIFEAEFFSWVLFNATLRYSSAANISSGINTNNPNNSLGLNFFLRGKHLFELNQKLTLFPLAELRYSMGLYQWNNKTGDEWPRENLKNGDTLDMYIGGGMDYAISERWKFNSELNYYIFLYRKSTADYYIKYSNHGPDIKLELGYGINEDWKLNTELSCTMRFSTYDYSDSSSYTPGLKLGLEYGYGFGEHLKLDLGLSYAMYLYFPDAKYYGLSHRPSLLAGIKYEF